MIDEATEHNKCNACHKLFRRGHDLDKQLTISVDKLCARNVPKYAAMKLLLRSTTRNVLNKGPNRLSATCVTKGSKTLP